MTTLRNRISRILLALVCVMLSIFIYLLYPYVESVYTCSPTATNGFDILKEAITLFFHDVSDHGPAIIVTHDTIVPYPTVQVPKTATEFK